MARLAAPRWRHKARPAAPAAAPAARAVARIQARASEQAFQRARRCAPPRRTGVAAPRAAASPAAARGCGIGQQPRRLRARCRRCWRPCQSPAPPRSPHRRAAALARVRPRQHGAMQHRRLQRIVSAQRHQRAAQKAERRQAIEQAQLAHGVGDIDGGLAGDAARPASGARQARAPHSMAMIGAAFGMARHEDGEQIGKLRPQHVMGRQHGLVLAGMGLGRQQHRPAADRLAHRRPARLRRTASGGASAFRLPTTSHIARAQAAEARRDLLVLRQHHVEGATAARPRSCGAQPPAAPPSVAEMRALTSASFTPRAARAQDQVGPEIGFHEQAGIRLPVIQKARHRAGRVQRHELMDARLRAAAGSSCAALVTVPLVTSTLACLASSFSIRGRADRLSPTLAPCTQIRRPAGRARPAMPSRSFSRVQSSLPRAARWRSSSGAQGDQQPVNSAPGREAQRQRASQSAPSASSRLWR